MQRLQLIAPSMFETKSHDQPRRANSRTECAAACRR
jgi:hypothetical protein